LEGLVDAAEERKVLGKELQKLQSDQDKLSKKLDNEGFLAKADPEVVVKTRGDLADIEVAIAQVEAQLASF
jgi:valyl-tRNA synthetase